MCDIYNNSYEELKSYYDDVLNKDKTTYKNSNDEPTPLGCIEEMLDKIPSSVWKEGVKVFDPCCGNGNFHLYAWNKLKEGGLSDKEIVQDSLYFNDINWDRLANVRKVYGEPINMTMFDFLKYPEEEKYDIVHANPPYAKFTKEGKRASKNHTMVRDFLSKSLKLLKDNGYLVFIIPDNWMSLADRNKVIEEITENQFIYLNIHGAKKWFPKIGSSFTWLVLQKKRAKDNYEVDCTYKGKVWNSTVKPGKRAFIPLLWTDTAQSIFAKTIEKNNEKFIVQTSSDLHKYTKKENIRTVQDSKFKYKLIHTPKQTVWANRPHKFHNGYKCFISTTDKYSIFVDNCGMTQSIAFIRCKDKKQAENFKKILDHELYVFLNNVCRWGNFNNIRILQKFPVPKNEIDIYGSFSITENEKKFIKQFQNIKNNKLDKM